MEHQSDGFFQVSVKGLCRDEHGRVLMIQERNGVWELPGGRLQTGEDVIAGLKRECQEEMGLDCLVLDTRPAFAYTTVDKEGRGRLMLFYAVQFDTLDFTPSKECVAIDFVAKHDIARLQTNPQLRLLDRYL